MPRALLISPSPLGTVGTGAMLPQVFADWRREDLAEIHSSLLEPDHALASSFYRLNEGERLIGPFPMRQAIRQLRFVTGQSEVTTLFFARITRRLDRWLDAFEPELVFTELGGLTMGRLALMIARRHRIPFHLFLTDDWVPGWPSNSFRRTLFPITNIANLAMRRFVSHAVDRAASLWTGTDELADEYRRRYGREWHVLQNCVDLTEWPSRPPRVAGSPARLAYSGSIFPYAQFSSLEDVRDAVGTLRTAGRDIELVIRTQHVDSPVHQRAFGSFPGVRMDGLVPRPEFAAGLAAADALLLPVNFDPVTAAFIRFSIPAKVTEYLASGTPILYYGPADVGQARFLARNGCALLVTTRDPAQLRASLERILYDTELRRDLSVRGRLAVERHFNIHVLRARLRDALVGRTRPT